MNQFITGIQQAHSFLKVRGQDFRNPSSEVLPQVSQMIFGGGSWRSRSSTKSLSLVMTTSAVFFAVKK
ncbi:MAG: hypothetical protein ABIP71_14680 [Verrucomicrobiota bacterium]